MPRPADASGAACGPEPTGVEAPAARGVRQAYIGEAAPHARAEARSRHDAGHRCSRTPPCMSPRPPARTSTPCAGRTRRSPRCCSASCERQADSLQLIAAENFTSPAVLAALGSPLANKYAEGYPGARHHGGCELVDAAERIAVERATALFGAEHANVQSHSGSSAVLAAYAALLQARRHGPGHGAAARRPPHPRLARQLLRPLVRLRRLRRRRRDRAHRLRAGRAPWPAHHRPKAIVCGSISYPRHLDYAAFREIADEVGAYLIADAAHPIGLVAGGAAPSPVPYADVVCATTHKVLRGPRGGMILCGAELAERIDRAVFPFTQGGAQMHTIAAKAVAFGEAATPGVHARTPIRWSPTRACSPPALAAEGFARHHRRHRHPSDHRRSRAARRRRPHRARAGSRPPGMVLDTCALPYGDGRGHPAGHRGGDHAGHGRRRDGADRGAVHGGAA